MEHPQNKGDTTRVEIVRVRVSLTEKQQLAKRAKDARLNISDWIRLQAINEKLVRKPFPEQEALYRLLAALGKIGANINQVSRHMNRKQDSEDFEIPVRTVMYLMDELKAIMAELRTTLARYASHSR